MTDPIAVGELPAEPASLLAIAEPIAVEVGSALVRSFDERRPAITAKSTPTDLVTELDLWAEETITEAILAARPDDSIQGEEGAAVEGTSGITWSVDPIDGTVNFIHHLSGFNVSIAAVVDGHPVAGVVVAPLSGEVFTATIGGGSFVGERPLRCAAPPSLARAVVATGFAYDPARRTRQAEVVARAIGSIADIRRLGAAAYDLCLVGAGRIDAYWEVGLNPWDHAAGGLVATEAGAVVRAIDGGPASSASVLAAPAELWGPMSELLVISGATDV